MWDREVKNLLLAYMCYRIACDYLAVLTCKFQHNGCPVLHLTMVQIIVDQNAILHLWYICIYEVFMKLIQFYLITETDCIVRSAGYIYS